MRGKVKTTPDDARQYPWFWEWNATLHTDPTFKLACLKFARKLREKANG